MALGFQRKELLEKDKRERIKMNAPFAFALGAHYKTNKARLYEIFDTGANIRIPMEETLPDIHYFLNVPFSFRLPGDQTTWRCKADINRIYSYDENEKPVYGLELKLKELSKEQLLQFQTYLDSRRGGGQIPQTQTKRRIQKK